MASFIVKNMQYVTGGVARSRIPRQPIPGPSNPPGLAQINGTQVIAQNASPGTLFHSVPPQPSFSIGGGTVYFAFTSMSGGTEGGQVTNDSSTQLTETVGPTGADIIQLNVYIAHGGYGPGGGSGAIIDAFDEATGMFVDDVFVDVAPDANGSITHDANYQGAFSSAGATEVVAAHSFIHPTNANFDKWLIMPGTSDNNHTIVAGNNLTVQKNSNVVAFAYYRHHTKIIPKEGTKEFGKEIIKEKELALEKPEAIDHIKLKGQGPEFTPPGDLYGDPAFLKQQIAALNEKLTTLEAKTSATGKAFVKAANRPAVGKAVAAKANKRK